MMSAAFCREKATEWAARATRVPEGKFKTRKLRITRNWEALAVTADAEESLNRRGLGRG